MENEKAASPASGCGGAPIDLVSRPIGIFLWCLPAAAVFVGLEWKDYLAWFWIPAFLIMGAACLANARSCGRLHCYLTGPTFVLAAIYVSLAAAGLAPPHPAILLDTVVVIVVLAFLAEVPFGKYRKRA